MLSSVPKRLRCDDERVVLTCPAIPSQPHLGLAEGKLSSGSTSITPRTPAGGDDDRSSISPTRFSVQVFQSAWQKWRHVGGYMVHARRQSSGATEPWTKKARTFDAAC